MPILRPLKTVLEMIKFGLLDRIAITFKSLACRGARRVSRMSAGRTISARIAATREEVRIERTYANLRDGTKQLLSVKVYPANPLPGVVYDDYGIPLPWTTAIRNRQLARERELDQIHSGASRGRRQGHEAKRDKTARTDEALLAAVRTHREKHPHHGGPAIAAALVDKHGTIRDHADPRGREKAIEALRKRIARLGKRLDK